MLGVLADVMEELEKYYDVKDLHDILTRAGGREVTPDDIRSVRRIGARVISPNKVAWLYWIISQIKHGEAELDPGVSIRTELPMRRSTYGFRLGETAPEALASTDLFHGEYIGVGPASLNPGEFFVIRWTITRGVQGLLITHEALHQRTKAPILYKGTGTVTGNRLDVKIENLEHIHGEPDEIITFLLSHDGTPTDPARHLYGVYVANGFQRPFRDVPSAALAIFVRVTPEEMKNDYKTVREARWIRRDVLQGSQLFSDDVKRFLLTPSGQIGMVQGAFRTATSS